MREWRRLRPSAQKVPTRHERSSASHHLPGAVAIDHPTRAQASAAHDLSEQVCRPCRVRLDVLRARTALNYSELRQPISTAFCAQGAYQARITTTCVFRNSAVA